MKKSPIRYAIYLLMIVVVLMALDYMSCHVETYCKVTYDNEELGEIDCNIVRQAGAFTLREIEDYACSDEVIDKVREKFNFGKITECHYYCCVTDGTCYGFPPRGINIQMLSLYS